MKKALKNLQNLKKLFEEHGTAELDLVGMNIGYDGKVYFLFSSGRHWQSRLPGRAASWRMWKNSISERT